MRLRRKQRSADATRKACRRKRHEECSIGFAISGDTKESSVHRSAPTPSVCTCIYGLVRLCVRLGGCGKFIDGGLFEEGAGLENEN